VVVRYMPCLCTCEVASFDKISQDILQINFVCQLSQSFHFCFMRPKKRGRHGRRWVWCACKRRIGMSDKTFIVAAGEV
jgi:hypothetical protein